MTSPSSVHETGHSKPVHWDNPEGWDGEGGGSGFGMEDTSTPVADSILRRLERGREIGL